MKIKDMIDKIHAVIYKRDMVDVLLNAQKELKTVCIPMYEDAEPKFISWTFKSNEIKRYLPTFVGHNRKMQGNIITTVKFALINLDKMISQVKPVIERHFQESTASSALTYRKAQYLQFIDAIKYYAEYSRLFLTYVIIAELADHDPGNTIAKRLTPMQIQKVESGLNSFALLTSVFNRSVADVMNLLNKTPDVIIDPVNIELNEKTLGPSAMDPLSMGFIDADTSPFWAVAGWLAVWQHDQFLKAKEERQHVSLLLIKLERAKAGSPEDPAIEKQIEYYQDRIAKLDKRIAEQEREYA